MSARTDAEPSARKITNKKARVACSGKMILVGNLKGGCGKSTLAFNLAIWLAERGVNPALVDMDPLRTLSDLVAVREEIGAKPRLAPPSTMLPPRGPQPILVDFGAGDLARIDAVAREADLALTPVLPSQADIWATQRYIKLLLAHGKPGARIALFVNRAEARSNARETHETLAALKSMSDTSHGVTALSETLGRRVAYCRSLSEGLGVFEMKGQKKAAKEFGRFAGLVMALL